MGIRGEHEPDGPDPPGTPSRRAGGALGVRASPPLFGLAWPPSSVYAAPMTPDEETLPSTAISRYTDFPDHPLRDVPQEVLDAARKMMHDEVVCCGDVDPDLADPIADLMVIAVLPWLRWGDENGSHTRTSTTAPDAGPDYCAECSERTQDWVPWPCENGREVQS